MQIINVHSIELVLNTSKYRKQNVSFNKLIYYHHGIDKVKVVQWISYFIFWEGYESPANNTKFISIPLFNTTILSLHILHRNAQWVFTLITVQENDGKTHQAQTKCPGNENSSSEK